MKILGISLGDTSTAAVMAGDKLAACASEERFSRRKRDEGYPKGAIDYCLTAAGVEGREIDVVAIGGVSWDFWRWLARYHSSFSVDDLAREQTEYFRPALSGAKVEWPQLFRRKLDPAQYPGGWDELAEGLGPDAPLGPKDQARADAFLDAVIAAHLGIDKSKIVRVDQHTALGAYAYWSSGLRGKGTGVLVLDAGREELGATAAAPLKFGLMRLCSVPASEFRVGRLIRDVTLMLGLPPRDHDPVVMGLAAHAPARAWRPAYRVFAKSMKVDGLAFRSPAAVKDTYFYFLERLKGLSDEAVAGGVQRFAEDLVGKWVANVAAGSRLSRLAVAGSLSMNHRIMARLAELDGIEELFVPPGAGDGALALGACLHLSTSRFGVVPAPLSHCYLGPGIDAAQIEKAVGPLRGGDSGCEVVEDVSPEQVARLLAEGCAVGRCAGRAEFGSRSLGNRSILVDPRNAHVVPFIAAKIKRRDANVPFSPTILAARAARYIKNSKALPSPFMTLSFAIKARARRDLAAAIDADEGTVRPQILEDAANPGFAALIRAFERLTGVGALLNTSLNDRGQPMALTAGDAVQTFLHCSLDYLLLGGTLIGKRSAALRRGRLSARKPARAS